MSELKGLEYIAFAVEASEGWRSMLHEPHHRSFGKGGSTRFEALGMGRPVVDATAELLAEQGDTLIILVHDEPAVTLALTVLTPTAGEMTVTSGSEWARCVVALLALPAAHHDH